MKNKLIILVLIFTLLIPNATFAENIINTDWVYDSTGSISEDTISFIQDLNEGILKDYQYAVYVTDTLDGESIDTFKTNLFNEYGLGTEEINSGILFVLATEDREYGLEFGDGVSGWIEKQLRNDFVPEVALSELKSADWDNAIYKVSHHLAEMVDEFELKGQLDNGVIDKKSNNTIPNSLMNNTVKVSESHAITDVLISFLIVLILIMLIIMLFVKLDDQTFFRSDVFNNYIEKFSLDKNIVKSELTANSSAHDLNQVSLYKYLLSEMEDYNLTEIQLRRVFSFNDFVSQKNTTVNQLRKVLNNKYKILVEKEEELEKRNNKWIDDIIAETTDSYSVQILDKLRNQFRLQDKYDYNDFKTIFHREYKKLEINYKLENLFPELTNREIKYIMNDVKKTREYELYVDGLVDTFTPSEEQIEQSSLYSRNEVGDISHKSSRDIWFWLWIYGMNSNRTYIKKEEQRKIEEEAKRLAARESAEEQRRINSTNSFGSSFGGGHSSGGLGGSGGGFSGKF